MTHKSIKLLAVAVACGFTLIAVVLAVTFAPSQELKLYATPPDLGTAIAVTVFGMFLCVGVMFIGAMIGGTYPRHPVLRRIVYTFALGLMVIGALGVVACLFLFLNWYFKFY